jgi:hypothetical protein
MNCEIFTYGAGTTYGGENYIISQNYITGNYVGISFSRSNSVISDNNITRNENGLSVYQCENVTVENNIISNDRADFPVMTKYYLCGLSLNANNINVYENNITDNLGFGVQFGSCNNSAVYSNNIMRNYVGIKLSNFGSLLQLAALGRAIVSMITT